MANNLTFTIGSVFKGEGFKQARDTVNEVNKSVRAGAETASKMASALGGMNNSASKAAGAMSSLIGAFMSGGASGVALAGATMALNACFGKMKKELDEVTARAAKAQEAAEKEFSSALTGRITSLNKEISTISGDFDRLTKQATQFAAALEGVRSAEASGGIITLQVEKLNALLEAHSDEERANIEAAYNLKVALQKSADTEAAWSSKIEAAHTAVTTNENKRANIDEQIAKISEERRNLEQSIIAIKQTSSNHWVEMEKQVVALTEQEAKLEQQKIDLETELDALRLNEKKVKIEATNAQASATLEIRNAELAEVKLTEAKNKRKAAEEKAKTEAELKAESDRELKDRQESAADIQRKVNDSARDLQRAQAEYAAALRKYEANWSDNKLFGALYNQQFDRMGKSNLQLGGGQLSGQMTEQSVKDALANGTVRTVKELNDFARQESRAARNEIAKYQNRITSDMAKWEKLQKVDPKRWSKQDKDFDAKMRALQNAANQQKKELDDAARKVVEEENRAKENAKNLAEINKKLAALGLK